MTRSLPQSIQLLLTVAVLVALVAAQQLFSLPGASSLMQSLQDSLHAPWFFSVVVVLCWWFRDRSVPMQLLAVTGIALALAFGTEFAQSYVADRSASRGDVVRNLVGGALGLVFSLAMFRRTKTPPLLRLSAASVCVAISAVVALVVFAAWQPWQELELRRYRDQLLPQIVDLTDERASRFLTVYEGSELRFEPANEDWPEYDGRQVLRLRFGEHTYPTLAINEVMQRWVPYSELAIDVFVRGDDPLPLTVAVQYEGSAGTSALQETVLAAGAHQWRIPRSKFVPDEATALRVRDVLIYTTADYAGRTVLLGSVKLQ